jgi:sporulation protein YlmC with PRC-barrel domain
MIHRLLGRRIRDVDGRLVGRITELRAEIELHETGSDYYVVELLVGAHGWLEALAGGPFARDVIRRLGRFSGYRLYRIPWQRVDFTAPDQPVLTCRRDELPT